MTLVYLSVFFLVDFASSPGVERIDVAAGPTLESVHGADEGKTSGSGNFPHRTRRRQIGDIETEGGAAGSRFGAGSSRGVENIVGDGDGGGETNGG